MTWRDIEKLMREDHFDVCVEPRRSGNKYWLRQRGNVHYPISSPQFDRLLEGGYIDPDYRVEHNGLYGAEEMVYRGR